MNFEKSENKSLENLNIIKEAIEKMEINCKIFEKSVDIPLDTLVIDIRENGENLYEYINCSFYPLQPEIENISLLQFYLEFTFKVPQDKMFELSRFVMYINAFIPVGQFGYTPSENKAHYRYVLAQQKNSLIDAKTAKDIITLIISFSMMFGQIIYQIVSGKMSYEEAITKIKIG